MPSLGHSIDTPYQRFELGSVRVDGVSDCAMRWKAYKLPDDFGGCSVLDVGAWDGYFAFESKRRGAGVVWAIDYPAWTGYGYQRFKDNLARLGYDIRHEVRDVCTLTPDFGQFDVVLFLQVLYHMHDPYKAMEAVASVCKHELWLETQVMGDDNTEQCFWPQMRDVWDLPELWPSRAVVETMFQRLDFNAELVTNWPDRPHPDYPEITVRRLAWHAVRNLA